MVVILNILLFIFQIPSSAVEMPGDLNSIGYLDVQFGAMDLIDPNTPFEGNMDGKYGSVQSNNIDTPTTGPASNLDLNAPNQNSNLDAYSPKNNTQASISSALSQSVSIIIVLLWLKVLILCFLPAVEHR